MPFSVQRRYLICRQLGGQTFINHGKNFVAQLVREYYVGRYITTSGIERTIRYILFKHAVKSCGILNETRTWKKNIRIRTFRMAEGSAPCQDRTKWIMKIWSIPYEYSDRISVQYARVEDVGMSAVTRTRLKPFKTVSDIMQAVFQF